MECTHYIQSNVYCYKYTRGVILHFVAEVYTYYMSWRKCISLHSKKGMYIHYIAKKGCIFFSLHNKKGVYTHYTAIDDYILITYHGMYQKAVHGDHEMINPH